MEALSFTLKLKEVPVEIEDVAGAKHDYTLRELQGKERDAYLDDVGKRLKYIGGKAAGFKNYEGLQAGLLALCLRDENGELVKQSVIQTFPSSVQTDLYKAAQDLSALKEEDEESEESDEAKND